MTILELLVEEIEEDLYACGQVGLYEFSWTARGMSHDLSPEELKTLYKQVYDHLTKRFALHLEWHEWPSCFLGMADSSTVLDFDMDSEADVSTPHLVLVPDDLNATTEELCRQFHPEGPPTQRRWWSRR